METSRRGFRVMMFYDYMEGLHQEKSLKNSEQFLGKNAPSRTQVFFSGSVNLDEAGGVSTTSTDAAH